jgi:hypothetical protein
LGSDEKEPPLTASRDGNDGPWSTFGIQVGTPSQQLRVLPATGLDMTWVVLPEGCTSSDPSDCGQSRGGIYFSNLSSTWDEIGIYQLSIYEEAMLGYTGNGSYGSETVTLGWPGDGQPSAAKQVVAEIATREFYMGALGLNPWPVNFTELDNSHPSLLSTLKNQSKIPSLTWAYTAGAYNYIPPIFGSLTLGGYDSSRFVPNSLNFSMGADISRDLLVAVQNISSAGSPLLSSPIYAYIDALVPYMWLPLDACQDFEAAFNLTWNDTAQLYLVDGELHQRLLEENQTVTMTIGPSITGDSVAVDMPYWSFMLNTSYSLEPGSLRYFPLKRAANDTQYTLGRVFLQNAYVIANYEFFNFSVYQARYPDTSVPESITALCPRGGCGATSTRLSTAAIAGIAIGIVVAAAVSLFGAWWLFFRSRRDTEDSNYQIHEQKCLPGKPEAGELEVPRHEVEGSLALPPELAAGTVLRGPGHFFELASNEVAASEMHTPAGTPGQTPKPGPNIQPSRPALAPTPESLPNITPWGTPAPEKTCPRF